MTTPFVQSTSYTIPLLPPPMNSSSNLIRHPIWFFYDADCFLVHHGIVLGLHRRIFDRSVLFNQLLTRTGSTHHIPIGTTWSLPIIIDNVPFRSLMGSLTLAYYPEYYDDTQIE